MANTPQLRKTGKTYGVSGTTIFSGIITGEEYSRQLSGLQALRTYDTMARSDADIHGILEVCKQPITATQWSIKPAKQPDGKVSDFDQKVADLVEHDLFHNNIDFPDLVYQALDMLDFGFSVFEKTYALNKYDGKDYIGFSEIAFRKQTTIFKWEMDNGKPGVTQRTTQGTYNIPAEKLVVFTNRKRGDNHQGVSILRYVYKDWMMKDNLTLVNGMALEQLAKGVVKASARDGQTISQKDKKGIEEALANFRAGDEGYIIEPSTVTIDMLDMKGNTTKDVLPTLAYHRRSIFTSIQATFLDLGGSSGSGAKSLSADLTSLFLKSEEYIARTICSVINQQIIKQFCDLNFTDLPNGYPELVNGSIGDEDITKMSDSLQKLTNAGLITPDAEMEDVLRIKNGMPAMPEDLKASYEERRQAALDAKNAPPQLPQGTDPKAAKEVKPVKKEVTKKQAALNASQDAYRKTIDVIFADED